MKFHEVRFPAALSFGSLGGPERRTEVVTLANGFEERNTPWAHSRRRYDAGVGMRSLEDIETMIAFFEARQGEMFGFRWKDWSDWLITFDEAPDDGVEITAGYEFDVPVRFDTGSIQTSVASFQAGEVPSVPVVEVRVA